MRRPQPGSDTADGNLLGTCHIYTPPGFVPLVAVALYERNVYLRFVLFRTRVCPSIASR